MLSGTKRILNVLSDSTKKSYILRKMKHATLISITAINGLAWFAQGIRYRSLSDLSCSGVVSFMNDYIFKHNFYCHVEQSSKSGPNAQPVNPKFYSQCDGGQYELNKCEQIIVCCGSAELTNVTTATYQYMDQQILENKEYAEEDFNNSWPLTLIAIPISVVVGPVIGFYYGYKVVNSAEWILEHDITKFPSPLQKLIFEYVDEKFVNVANNQLKFNSLKKDDVTFFNKAGFLTPLLAEQDNIAIDIKSNGANYSVI